MSYSTDVSNLIAKQLARHATLSIPQLSGHMANIDFWLAEFLHALAVIDGYGTRFVRMETAQQHSILSQTSDVHREPPHDFPARSNKLHRVPHQELQKARRELTKAAERFAERCHSEGLMTDQQYSEWINR